MPQDDKIDFHEKAVFLIDSLPSEALLVYCKVRILGSLKWLSRFFARAEKLLHITE
jgi:hypothetical protein